MRPTATISAIAGGTRRFTRSQIDDARNPRRNPTGNGSSYAAPMDHSEVLRAAAERGIAYRARLHDATVTPTATPEELRAALGGPMPEHAVDPGTVLTNLADVAEAGGLMGMGSGRFFGFVIGGAVPAAIGADWLVTAWDQNTGLFAPSPATSVIEEIAGRWIVELLGLPSESSFAFVTGGQMANTTALAAARHHVLAAAGLDVEADGLAGSPRSVSLSDKKCT